MDFSRAGEVFDLYVDWKRRLAREIPFLERVIGEPASGSRTLAVADVACGTGRHAIALASSGYAVTGIDPDAGLLETARKTAEAAAADAVGAETAAANPEWIRAAFDTLPALNMDDRFDAVLCLGNSISLSAPADLPSIVANMAAMVAPGGALVLHTINYPALARRSGEPWGPVRVLDDGTLLLKGFVPRDDGPWDAIFVVLRRLEDGRWDRTPYRFGLHPHERSAVIDAAERCGCRAESCWGGFGHGGGGGEDPDDPASADLVYLLRKPAG
jgi:SAM-dependent methyltransferase